MDNLLLYYNIKWIFPFNLFWNTIFGDKLSYISRKKIENFIFLQMDTIDGVLLYVNECNNENHFQQVAYSVNGQCLTMICFVCEKVVSNYRR